MGTHSSGYSSIEISVILSTRIIQILFDRVGIAEGDIEFKSSGSSHDSDDEDSDSDTSGKFNEEPEQTGNQTMNKFKFIAKQIR